MVLNNIIDTIKKAESIAILPHISVDGDGLGSSLALALALRKLNKPVNVYLEEDVPYIYSFLPGQDLICRYEEGKKELAVVIALDSGDKERLGSRVRLFERAYTTANIDHHATNSQFAFYNYVDTGSSAVGEIVYQMIRMMEISLDADIATCLYVAITTDTGGFRYSNTTGTTHRITADLIEKGVNIAEISQKVFETTSHEKVKLTGEAINSLEILEQGRIAMVVLTDEMLRKTGAKDEDIDGIVNIGRNIRGVEVSVVLRERSDGQVKGNLRSKSYVDVSSIAGLFGGGGHKRAAGFVKDGKVQAIKEQLLKDVREAL